MSTIFADKFKNTSGGNPVQINQLRGIDTAGSITVQGEGTATTNLQQGLAKSWITYTTVSTTATQDSNNISGVTDNGTGDTTLAFTSNYGNINFCSTGGGSYAPSNGSGCDVCFDRIGSNGNESAPTTSAKRCNSITTDNGSIADLEYNYATFHGDLA